MLVRTALLVLMVLMVVQAAVSIPVSSIERQLGQPDRRIEGQWEPPISSIQGRRVSSCDDSQCLAFCKARYGQRYIGLNCDRGTCWFYPKKLLSAASEHNVAVSTPDSSRTSPCDDSECMAFCEARYGERYVRLTCTGDNCWFKMNLVHRQ